MVVRARGAQSAWVWARVALLAVLLAAFAAPGIANGQVLTTLEFSFSNPGARSMGLGGAFVALADDATAAFANPAGLTQLVEPEVSIEGRSWSYESPYTSGGRAGGAPTGIGIDTVALPLRAESTADLTGLSFVSLVYPVRGCSIAIFQHQLLNFEMTQEIQGIFEPGITFAGSYRGPIERGFFDFDVRTSGLATGIRVSERLSLGLGLSYFDSSSYFVGDEYLPDDSTLENYFASSAFPQERLSEHVRVALRGGDWGLTAGFLWGISRSWKLGGVYRQGPELELEGLVTAGPLHKELAEGTQVFLGRAPWDLPDVYGLGFSYRSPDGHWAAGSEWTRVEYSTILESLPPELAGDGNFVDDADEIRLGGEYAFFLGLSVVALRLGAWHDPDHLVRNEGDAFARAEHPPGSDETHLAAGFGVAFEKLQMDAGVDLSDRIDSASLSLIYSF